MPDRGQDQSARVEAIVRAQIERLRVAMVKTLKTDGLRWEGAMQASVRGPLALEGGKGPDQNLAVRSGSLRRSFGHEVLGLEQLHGMRLVKYSTSRYAKIHEFGGVIRPVKGRYLTVPLRAAMTPSGVPRMPNARAWPDTFVYNDRYGHLFIAQDPNRQARLVAAAEGYARLPRGTKKKLILLYMLVDQVTIPPRLRMRETHRSHGELRRSDLRNFHFEGTQGVTTIRERAGGT